MTDTTPEPGRYNWEDDDSIVIEGSGNKAPPDKDTAPPEPKPKD